MPGEYYSTTACSSIGVFQARTTTKTVATVVLTTTTTVSTSVILSATSTSTTETATSTSTSTSTIVSTSTSATSYSTTTTLRQVFASGTPMKVQLWSSQAGAYNNGTYLNTAGGPYPQEMRQASSPAYSAYYIYLYTDGTVTMFGAGGLEAYWAMNTTDVGDNYITLATGAEITAGGFPLAKCVVNPNGVALGGAQFRDELLCTYGLNVIGTIGLKTCSYNSQAWARLYLVPATTLTETGCTSVFKASQFAIYYVT